MSRLSVLGVDLSGFSCGWAVMEANGRLGVHGVSTPDEKKTFWDRQNDIVQGIEMLLRMQKNAGDPVRRVVIEQIRLFHQGGISLAAIRDLGRLSGAIGYVATLRGAEIIEVHVGHWRKRVLGNGRATKDDVVAWADKKYGVKAKRPDEAEAICLAVYGHLVGGANDVQGTGKEQFLRKEPASSDKSRNMESSAKRMGTARNSKGGSFTNGKRSRVGSRLFRR